jgi:ABC-type thiamine transport system substrate-binding protein
MEKRLAVVPTPVFTTGVANARRGGAAPVSVPKLKPMGLMQLLAPLLAVILAVVLALLAAWALSMSAAAQIAHPTAEESYAGADRMAKLVAGAKKEGLVAVYTSAAMDDMAAVIAAFEKKYGVKVRLWRGSSENIVQRAVTEARGGRFEADVIETGALAMESMRRERLFQEIKTPALSELLAPAILPHREWVGTRFNIFAAAYNTRLVKKDELPKNYDDLLDRRWKGKLGVEAEDSDWFGGVVTALGEDKGLALFREIVAANGLSVRKGHTLLANLVVGGEVPFALTTYAYKAEQTAQERRADRLAGTLARRRAPRGDRCRSPRRAPARRDPVLRVHAHGRAGHLARSRLLSGAGECKGAARGCGFAFSRSGQSAR